MQKIPETKKICIVLAAKTDFSVEKATAVDLYVHHYALVSRFKFSTIVIADARGRPLPNIEFHNLAGARRITLFTRSSDAFRIPVYSDL
jgi:hypothetical protein